LSSRISAQISSIKLGSLFLTLPIRVLNGQVDLLRKSGEFPVSNEELDETATTVYKGI
jgi:hypothetical protein